MKMYYIKCMHTELHSVMVSSFRRTCAVFEFKILYQLVYSFKSHPIREHPHHLQVATTKKNFPKTKKKLESHIVISGITQR